MSMLHPWLDAIQLRGSGSGGEAETESRISNDAARRQSATAQAILGRLRERPGVILADEVGMGKTFVALAVAACTALDSRAPVVVMVPPQLITKWPKDFSVFKQECLTPELRGKLRAASARNAIEFLRLIDDPPGRRPHIVFLTHGAMTRRLRDPWVRLAIMRAATERRHGAAELRERAARWMPDLLRGLPGIAGIDSRLWSELLQKPPETWLKLMQRHDLGELMRDRRGEFDDPVPRGVTGRLTSIGTMAVYEALDCLPKRASAHVDARLQACRSRLSEAVEEVWRHTLANFRWRMPLVILDEAHHVKNASTQLASLFRSEDALRDAEEFRDRGIFGHVFERMLFLTATPFQLGHQELCSVLERFDGIHWKSPRRPELSRQMCREEIAALRSALDQAQQVGQQLDRAWGRVRREDVEALPPKEGECWWSGQGADLPAPMEAVRCQYRIAAQVMNEVQARLRPWVIRHLRPRTLGEAGATQVPRREELPGDAIIEDKPGAMKRGIQIAGKSLLPFLLAARLASSQPEKRPVFAEGLASSYAAFLETPKGRLAVLDEDDQELEAGLAGDQVAEGGDGLQRWYYQRMRQLVDQPDIRHPKVDATVERAVKLWRRGEKVVVFCFYRHTGATLHQQIAQRIDDHLTTEAARHLGVTLDEAPKALKRLEDRFFDRRSPLARVLEKQLDTLVHGRRGVLGQDAEAAVAVMQRFFRSGSFLVRYLLPGWDGSGRLDERSAARLVAGAMNREDASGRRLRKTLEHWLDFLARCATSGIGLRSLDADKGERELYLVALRALATGHSWYPAEEPGTEDDGDERSGSRARSPVVRLVNGSTDPATRARLMLTFNTPFLPDILVASAVMAEGVDLHLNCRHVIHHDLCWNPSTLEQRTGRVDRLRAKCEQVVQPVRIYLPYIEETQDDKMYQVVMDRQRWFTVVMGEKYQHDTRTVEKLADRVPFPDEAAQGLALKLEVEMPAEGSAAKELA